MSRRSGLRTAVLFGLGAGLAASPFLTASPLLLLPVAALAVPAFGRRLFWPCGIAAVAAGLLLGNLRLSRPVEDGLEATIRRHETPAFAWVRGRVGSAEPWAGGSRVILEASAFEEGGHWRPASSRIRATLPVPPPPEGAPVEASLRLSEPPSATNPGQFDLEGHLEKRGVTLTASCRSPALVRTGPPPPWRLASRYRHLLEQRLVEDGGRWSGVLLAVLLGERGLLPDDQGEWLARSGLFHLVALSGLHVGLILVLLAAAAHAAGLHPLRRDQASLALIGLYGILAAPSPSLGRALLMAGLFVAARMWGRGALSLQSLAAAACVLLLTRPTWVSDVGFQLTFAATFGILALWEAMPSPLRADGFRGAVARLLWIGVSAQLATLPFLAFSFHRVSLLGWLATPLASLPLMAIQAAGLPYLMGLAFVPGLHDVLGWALRCAAAAFVFIPEKLAAVSWGAVFVPSPWWGWVALFGAGFLLAAVAGRARRMGFVVLTAAVVSAWCVPGPFHRAGDGVVVLDVGQACCMVLRAGDRTVLVDAGTPSPEGPTSARTVIEPFLAASGIRSLSGIVLTHWDTDHAGAVADLIGDMPVGFLAYPRTDGPRSPGTREVIGASGIRLVPLERGDRLSVGRISLLALHPAYPSGLGDENERSLVLRAEMPGASVLASGDIGQAGEAAALAGGLLGPAYLQLAPHHGSAHSGSLPWIAATRPAAVVFCVGRANRYGHPAAATVERFASAGARVLRTDADGALLMKIEGSRPLLFRFRDGDWSSEWKKGGASAEKAAGVPAASGP